jgi:hypothetical protein
MFGNDSVKNDGKFAENPLLPGFCSRKLVIEMKTYVELDYRLHHINVKRAGP